MSIYINNYDPSWYGLFSKNNSIENLEKKIFLIGSSTVYPIDTAFINGELSLNEINYEIFNLADMSDSPKKRLQSLSNIISHQPDIIIYGLDVETFKIPSKSDSSFYEIILDPKNMFKHKFADVIQPIKENIPGSPKDRTLLTLKYFLFGPTPHHHPFINYYETSITPINILKESEPERELGKLDLSDTSEQIISLKKIISEIKKNDIKLVFFSSPYLITPIIENDIERFEKMLETQSEEYDVPVFFLHDKYIEMEIWRDGIHIAINEDTQIFSKDILEILLKEINPDAV